MPAQATTGIVILAAGASTRMGRPKQLLRFRGESMIQRSLRTALKTPFRPVVVVLGAFAEEIEPELEGYEAEVVYNSSWKSGMGGSVAVGLEGLLRQEPRLESALFLLVDQPYLKPAQLIRMAEALEGTDKPGVVSAYGDTLGVPALFRRALFPELLQLQGQKGAKPLIEKYRPALLALPFPQGKADLDTPEDWRTFLKDNS